MSTSNPYLALQQQQQADQAAQFMAMQPKKPMPKWKKVLIAVVILLVIVVIAFLAFWFGGTAKLTVPPGSKYTVDVNPNAGTAFASEYQILIPLAAYTGSKPLAKAYLRKAWLYTAAFGGTRVAGTVIAVGPASIRLAVSWPTMPVGADAVGGVAAGDKDYVRVITM